MHLVVVGLNHKTAPVETREQLSIEESRLPQALNDLTARAQISESVILSTCNRTEVYACCASSDHDQRIAEWLGSYCNLAPQRYAPYLYFLHEREAAAHLFRVASGIDSMVTGEDQILGQVKTAYSIARKVRSTGAVLNYLFHHAISVGKRVRTETAIGRGAFSVGSAAARLAESIFDNLAECTVMVVGAGKMAEQTVLNLAGAGAKHILVANRSRSHAADLAQRCGGRPVDFGDLEAVLPSADIVIASTSAREPIIKQPMLRRAISARRGRPMFVIDIAVPRNVDPSAASLDGVFLYNIDDLQAVVEKDKNARKAEIERAEIIIGEELERFFQQYRARQAVPVISAMRSKFEAIRQAEINKLKRRFPELTSEQMEAIEAMTRSMVSKICHDPTLRIKDYLASDKPPVDVNVLCELFGICPDAANSEEGSKQ
ncbi:MAG: glutamyl-tRNA reductase [Armatimonadota bacterium]|nr:glutamyl-tRNA reductase [Armatimonadota bacterium]